MPYVQRDASGKIIGQFANPQDGAAEFLADDAPELVKDGLLAYANEKQTAVMYGGTTVNVGTTAAPVNIMASTDAASLVLLQGAYTMAAANVNATFNWVTTTGPTTLTAAQITTLFNTVTTFMQNSFNVLTTALSGINGGTITTIAQIDALSWSG